MDKNRLFFGVFLLIAIYILPWWMVVFIAIIGIYIFKNYYEFLIVIFFIYGLYLYNMPQKIASPASFTIVVFLTFFVLQKAKDFIILYKNKN